MFRMNNCMISNSSVVVLCVVVHGSPDRWK